MTSAPYEPWTPQLGQRVKVVLSPECDYCNVEEDGRIGTVVTLGHLPGVDSYRIAAHRVWVRFDDVQPLDTGASNFAVVELEPCTHGVE